LSRKIKKILLIIDPIKNLPIRVFTVCNAQSYEDCKKCFLFQLLDSGRLNCFDDVEDLLAELEEEL